MGAQMALPSGSDQRVFPAMQLHKVQIKNFRLLRDIEMILEKDSTVVVGRNNSGKTSLAELFSRLLGDGSPRFSLEDFSIGAHEDFWAAFELKRGGADDPKVRAALPFIEANLMLTYSKGENLAPLTDFIIDLNTDCVEVLLCARYELSEGSIKALFDDIELPAGKPDEEQRAAFFKAIKERIPKHFRATLFAVDPGDDTNRKPIEWPRLRALIQGGFINAQRGLDDTTDAANDVLGKILGSLFKTAKAESAAASDKATAKKLETAVEGVQGEIDRNFSEHLKELLPAIALFGYPGLPDPRLRTETTLGVERLLKDHTRIRYPGVNGVNLPEGYNGLGARNLIFILFKLIEFFKEFQAAQSAAGVHVVFIEEPEAHLHPQMQEVFIKKLADIAAQFAKLYNSGKPWPVQFVVTTHSSHVANKAPFRAMRYFLAVPDGTTGHCKTRVKDLGQGFSGNLKDDEEFLHQYMTLTRCDLLFADRAILIEGTSERLLLPKMVEKVDAGNDGKISPLASQYVSVVEVGGAYAHRFFKLLDFLELRTLVITDLDSVNTKDGGKACRVGDGTHSSNGCINGWFKTAAGRPSLAEIRAKTAADKVKGKTRIAFQIPEKEGKATGKADEDAFLTATGRSFEDAFFLANPKLFGLSAGAADDVEKDAWAKTRGIEKANFALEYGIEKTAWDVPRYIKEGLTWLASDTACDAGAPTPVVAPAPAPILKTK